MILVCYASCFRLIRASILGRNEVNRCAAKMRKAVLALCVIAAAAAEPAAARKKPAAAPAKQTSPATAPKPADKPKEAPKKRWGKKESAAKALVRIDTAVRSSNLAVLAADFSTAPLWEEGAVPQIKGLPRHHHGRFCGIGQSSSAQTRRERTLRVAGREDAIQARRGRAGDQRGQQN